MNEILEILEILLKEQIFTYTRTYIFEIQYFNE